MENQQVQLFHSVKCYEFLITPEFKKKGVKEEH